MKPEGWEWEAEHSGLGKASGILQMGGVGEWSWPFDAIVGSALSSTSTHPSGDSVFQTPHWKGLGSGSLGRNVPQAQVTHPGSESKTRNRTQLVVTA